MALLMDSTRGAAALNRLSPRGHLFIVAQGHGMKARDWNLSQAGNELARDDSDEEW